MSINIPTTQEIVDRSITFFESNLNQTIPLNPKAFVRILCAILGMNYSELYRYAVERALQTLALTATGDDLVLVGNNYGIYIKPSEAFECTADLPALNGTNIPVNWVFVSDTTALRYRTKTTVVAVAGVALLELVAEDPGSDPNMSVSETLTIDTQIAGAESTATITVIINDGIDKESDESYRRRILNEIRTVGGGGNGVDYRTWAEQTPGVFRAFPYAGTPLAILPTPKPGDRTVFIECDTSIDPDGIPPSGLLDDARDYITTNPDTGKTRPPLGEVDSTLWIEPITRTTFYTEIDNLSVDPTILVQVKADIATALSEYYFNVVPYLPGVDSIVTKNDIITRLTISEVVQDILNPVGGTADQVNFGIAPGVFTLATYTLGQGELGKTGGETYV